MAGLTNEEEKERTRLLELQKISSRWFSQEEFERLHEFSKKLFESAGSPTQIKGSPGCQEIDPPRAEDAIDD